MHVHCLYVRGLSARMCTVTLPLLTKEPFLNFPFVCVFGGGDDGHWRWEGLGMASEDRRNLDLFDPDEER